MSQTFEYPNLLIGSRSGYAWSHDNGGMEYFRPNGAKQHALRNSTKNKNFIKSPLFPLKHGITYAFSVFTANSANCAGSEIWILHSGGGDGWIAGVIDKAAKGPGGGWTTKVFSLPSISPEGNYYLRFDNNGSTDGKNTLIWFDSPMLCIASEPHAWAPAEEEMWP